MSTENYDAAALFAFPALKSGMTEAHGLEIRERPGLIEAVRYKGCDVYVVRGGENIDADTANALSVSRPEYGTIDSRITWLNRLGEQSLEGYGVIRSYTKLPHVEHIVPVHNPLSLKMLSRDKYRAAREVLEPLGLYRKYMYVPNNSQVDLEQIEGPLVAKPINAAKSRGVFAGTHSEVAEALKHVSEDYIVEERLRFDEPMLGIRGRNEHAQRKLNNAYAHGANTELRMYSFGIDSDWHPIARVSQPGKLEKAGDEWVVVDETTVPDELYQKANAVKQVVDNVTHTIDTMFTVDFAYAACTSKPTYSWQVMEIEAEPYVIRTDVDMVLGLRFRNLLAEQIARIAKSRRN